MTVHQSTASLSLHASLEEAEQVRDAVLQRQQRRFAGNQAHWAIARRACGAGSTQVSITEGHTILGNPRSTPGSDCDETP